MSDTTLFLLINRLAGRVPFVDEIFKGLANDYFLPIICSFIVVALWFGTRDIRRRGVNQRASITAVMSIGIVAGMVDLCDYYFFRARPFTEIPLSQMHLLFYRPTDSSFPSNFAAILFAIAVSILIKNKGVGIILLVIALLGGFARIYVGIHYPLDILGGAAFGTLASFTAYGLSRILEPVFAGTLAFLRGIYLA
jgi:undecaprenyl-diphosphatase